MPKRFDRRYFETASRDEHCVSRPIVVPFMWSISGEQAKILTDRILSLERLRNRMLSPVRHMIKPKSWQRQGVGVLCCLLGLIWVGNPIFHSVCHLVDLPHQHPTGPAFGHGHSHSHGHSHAHDMPSSRLSDEQTASEQAPGSDPDSPHREPSDSEGPLLFIQSLETETCCPAHHCLHRKQAPPALGTLNLDSVNFFSSAELGTSSARGPPILLDVC